MNIKKYFQNNRHKTTIVTIVTVAGIIGLLFAHEARASAEKDTNAQTNKVAKIISRSNADPYDAWAWKNQVAPNGVLLNPFADLIRMQHEINDWFGQYMGEWDSDNNPDMNNISFAPRMDLQDNEKNYVISMDIPGIDKSDIKITVKDRILAISGTRKKSTEEKKGSKILRMERYYGQFERAIRLPGEVDENAIVANYKNGVLTVTIPKKAIEKKGEITIPVQ